jgi:ectoine hydroxylase-related dioxygenase (phytanoyl-CoA dioxygenase family)
MKKCVALLFLSFTACLVSAFVQPVAQDRLWPPLLLPGSSLAGSTNEGNDDVSLSTGYQHPGPSFVRRPLWTSRRGLLQATISATAAPWLLNVSGAAAGTASSSFSNGKNVVRMADPGVTQDAMRWLAKQADAAAATVTDAHRQEYLTTGATKVANVISKQWVEALREGCEVAQDEAGSFAEYLQKPTDSGIFFSDLELARRLPLFSAFSLYGPAAAVAGSVMGSDTVRYLYDQLFVKEEGVTTQTPWHQDGGYWRVHGNQVCSVFCPLDPVKPMDGLSFVSGSHKWKLYNPQHFADGTPYVGTKLPTMPDISRMVDDGEIFLKSFSLEPGDCLVFSARTVHGGAGNWGRALSTRWVGDDGRFWDRPGEGAIPTGNVNLHSGELLANNEHAFPASWVRSAV